VQCLVSVLPLFGDWIYAASGTRSHWLVAEAALYLPTGILGMAHRAEFRDAVQSRVDDRTDRRVTILRTELALCRSATVFCENLACLAGICSTLSEAICKSSTMFKTWFITGGSSGFGRALTETLLARGDRVTATVRKVHVLDDLKTASRWHGSLTDTEEVRRVVDRTSSRTRCCRSRDYPRRGLNRSTT
jgi:hypothetical protein